MKKIFDSVGATIGRPKNKRAKNTPSKNHLIRQASLTPSPRGEGNRRGFTIVELVMALFIIVLVSSVAIGVVAVDNKTHAETIQMIEATNIAENAVECFRVARNATDGVDVPQGSSHCLDMFEHAFKISLGCKKDETDPTITHYPNNVGFEMKPNENDSTTIICTVTKGGVTVTLVFSDGIEDDVKFSYNTITITATNSEGEELLETKSYTVR